MENIHLYRDILLHLSENIHLHLAQSIAIDAIAAAAIAAAAPIDVIARFSAAHDLMGNQPRRDFRDVAEIRDNTDADKINNTEERDNTDKTRRGCDAGFNQPAGFQFLNQKYSMKFTAKEILRTMLNSYC